MGEASFRSSIILEEIRKKVEEEKEKFEEIIRSQPSNLVVRLDYRRFLAKYGLLDEYYEQSLIIADLFIEEGKYEAAKTELERLVRIFPKEEKVRKRLIDLYATLGDEEQEFKHAQKLATLLILNDRGSEALKVLEKLQEKFPDSLDIRFSIARVYRDEGYQNKALAEYEAIAAKAEAIGDIDSAIKARSEIKYLLPDNIENIKELARLFEEKGDYQQAISEYRSILRFDINNIIALEGLGRVSYKTRDYGNARSAYKKLLKIDPDNPEYNLMFGLIMMNMRNKKNAIPHLEKAANSFMEMEDFKKAKEALEALVMIDPKNSNYRSKLNEVNLKLEEEKKREKAATLEAEAEVIALGATQEETTDSAEEEATSEETSAGTEPTTVEETAEPQSEETRSAFSSERRRSAFIRKDFEGGARGGFLQKGFGGGALRRGFLKKGFGERGASEGKLLLSKKAPLGSRGALMKGFARPPLEKAPLPSRKPSLDEVKTRVKESEIEELARESETAQEVEAPETLRNEAPAVETTQPEALEPEAHKEQVAELQGEPQPEPEREVMERPSEEGMIPDSTAEHIAQPPSEPSAEIEASAEEIATSEETLRTEVQAEGTEVGEGFAPQPEEEQLAGPQEIGEEREVQSSVASSQEVETFEVSLSDDVDLELKKDVEKTIFIDILSEEISQELREKRFSPENLENAPDSILTEYIVAMYKVLPRDEFRKALAKVVKEYASERKLMRLVQIVDSLAALSFPLDVILELRDVLSEAGLVSISNNLYNFALSKLSSFATLDKDELIAIWSYDIHSELPSELKQRFAERTVSLALKSKGTLGNGDLIQALEKSLEVLPKEKSSKLALKLASYLNAPSLLGKYLDEQTLENIPNKDLVDILRSSLHSDNSGLVLNLVKALHKRIQADSLQGELLREALDLLSSALSPEILEKLNLPSDYVRDLVITLINKYLSLNEESKVLKLLKEHVHELYPQDLETLKPYLEKLSDDPRILSKLIQGIKEPLKLSKYIKNFIEKLDPEKLDDLRPILESYLKASKVPVDLIYFYRLLEEKKVPEDKLGAWLDWLDSAVDNLKRDEEISYKLTKGIVSILKGDYEGADSFFRNVILSDKSPEIQAVTYILMGFSGLERYLRGKFSASIFISQNSLRKAMRFLSNLPDDPFKEYLEALLKYQRGLLSELRGQLKEAKELFKELAELDLWDSSFRLKVLQQREEE